MAIQAINPATNEILATYDSIDEAQLKSKLDKSKEVFDKVWKNTDFAQRAKYLNNAAQILRKYKPEYSKLIAEEMGKPIAQCEGEIEKSAWNCEYFATNAEKFLALDYIESEAVESYVRFDPIGTVLEVMPWNFPFWQVFRVSPLILMAGNCAVLKHASNVPRIAMVIEEIFKKAGLPEYVFLTLMIDSKQTEQVIRHDAIQAVTLTGSEGAGSAVASIAGREIKKVVMELGGSDAFIVLPDADIDFTVAMAVKGRTRNNGQVCTAAKRFIVVEKLYNEFIEKMAIGFGNLKIGDPLDMKTELGPLISAKALDELHSQVQDSVRSGARLICGGDRVGEKGNFYAPTILADVIPGMKAFDEELFGPVASVIKANDTNHAIELANNHRYGLGASLWTKDREFAKRVASQIDAGNVFINDLPTSHPHMPIGGIKKSGFGRELSYYGIKEFVNIKTVWVK